MDRAAGPPFVTRGDLTGAVAETPKQASQNPRNHSSCSKRTGLTQARGGSCIVKANSHWALLSEALL